MQKKILVLASTFPINDSDNVPNFVKDQIIEFKNINQSMEFIIIAPSVKNQNPQKNNNFTHLRYRYFFRKMERLTEKGILPTIKNNPVYVFLIPLFIISQIFFTIKIVKRNKPHHIYAHWVTPQAITALIVKKLYNIPFSFSSHAHDAEILTKLPIVGKYLLNSIVKNSYKFTFDSINTELLIKGRKISSRINQVPIKNISRKDSSRFGEGIKTNIIIITTLLKCLIFIK